MPVLGGTSGTGAVASVNTKTGAVVLAASDVGADAAGAAATAQSAALAGAASDAASKVATETTRATTAEALLAPKASPALTGTPTVNGTALGNAATKNVGTTTGTVAAGNDSRLANLANQRLLTQYGQDPVTGLPNSPWQAEATVGTEYWQLSKFSTNTNGLSSTSANATNNTSTLTPSLSGNASASALNTRIALSASDNDNAQRWRVSAIVNMAARTSAGFRLRIRPCDNTGANITWLDERGVTQTNFVEIIQSGAALTNYHLTYEIDVVSVSPSGYASYLDICLVNDGGGSADGSISLSNVSVKRVNALTPFARVAWDRATGGTTAGAYLYIDCPIGQDPSGNRLWSRHSFSVEGSPLNYVGNSVFFGATATSYAYGPMSSSYPTSTQAVNNSDVIIGAYKADGVTAELRGNAHGGEAGATGTFTSDAQVFLDYGDGNGWTGPYIAQWANELWRRCLRVKIVVNTTLTRSDQGTPFASIAKTTYVYRDGTIRVDRTLTFLQDQKISHLFWHMMSLQTGIQSNNFKGKSGAGLNTLVNYDGVNTYLAAPVLTAAPTVATTGGSIPANLDANSKYSVRVTAIDAFGGESAPSLIYNLVHVGTAGSTITPTWSAVTGAVGYAVYFGMAGFERRVATTTSTSYTILGTELSGQTLPLASTAPTGTGNSMASTGNAEWAIYFDPQTQSCISMAIDRAAVLAMPGVAGIRADLQRQNGSIFKNYWHLLFTGNDLPATVPSGTVFTSTGGLWIFSYVPGDPVAFERDQAPRASSASVLAATIYPAT